MRYYVVHNDLHGRDRLKSVLEPIWRNLSMATPFVSLPNTFKCELVYVLHSQRVENVYHVKSGGALTEADADRIAGKLLLWWQNHLRGQVSNGASLQLIQVTDAENQGGIGKIYTTSLPQAGSVAVGPSPGSVTIAIKWSTGFTGRSFRGRTYHIGVPSSAVYISGNQITTAYQSSLQTVYNALISGLNTGTADRLVVASKRHNNAWRPDGVVTNITSCSVELNLDSQRRRLTGPGRGD